MYRFRCGFRLMYMNWLWLWLRFWCRFRFRFRFMYMDNRFRLRFWFMYRFRLWFRCKFRFWFTVYFVDYLSLNYSRGLFLFNRVHFTIHLIKGMVKFYPHPFRKSVNPFVSLTDNSKPKENSFWTE